MTVAEMIELLSSQDRNAVLVISGVLVEGIDGPVSGRIREDYMNRSLTKTGKGRENAVFFTHATELSDGTIVQVRF